MCSMGEMCLTSASIASDERKCDLQDSLSMQRKSVCSLFAVITGQHWAVFHSSECEVYEFFMFTGCYITYTLLD